MAWIWMNLAFVESRTHSGIPYWFAGWVSVGVLAGILLTTGRYITSRSRQYFAKESS